MAEYEVRPKEVRIYGAIPLIERLTSGRYAVEITAAQYPLIQSLIDMGLVDLSPNTVIARGNRFQAEVDDETNSTVILSCLTDEAFRLLASFDSEDSLDVMTVRAQIGIHLSCRRPYVMYGRLLESQTSSFMMGFQPDGCIAASAHASLPLEPEFIAATTSAWAMLGVNFRYHTNENGVGFGFTVSPNAQTVVLATLSETLKG